MFDQTQLGTDMACRNQHFIQQLLAKGFSYDHPKKPCHVWVYRHDGKVFPASTIDYGAERDFYGNPGESNLDGRISDTEKNRFDAFVAAIRSTDVPEVDPEEAAAFSIFVWFRSRNYRSVFASGMPPLAERVHELMKQGANLEKFVAETLKTNPAYLMQVLAALGALPEAMPVIGAQGLLREFEPFIPKLAQLLVQSNRQEMEHVFSKASAGVSDAVAQSHRRELNRGLPDLKGSRLEQLSNLKWRIMASDSALIMGDSVAFAELQDGTFKICSEPGDNLAAVWVPITSNRILVGYSGGKAPFVDVTRLNQGAAGCSFDGFCAAAGPETHRHLIATIRTTVFCLADDAVDRIVLKALENVSG